MSNILIIVIVVDNFNYYYYYDVLYLCVHSANTHAAMTQWEK